MSCFYSQKDVFGYGLFGKSVVVVVLPTKQKEAQHMARISISDLYRGEGPGEKYGGILNAVFQEVFTNGIPEGCDERTWIELLTVKHTFLTAKKMAEQGDVVSELTEAASPFCAAEQGAQLCSKAQQSATRPSTVRRGRCPHRPFAPGRSGDAAQRHGMSLRAQLCATTRSSPPDCWRCTRLQRAPKASYETGKEEEK